MHKNMPVIAGFRFDGALSPLVVVRNKFARIVGDGKPESEIDTMIDAWIRHADQQKQ